MSKSKTYEERIAELQEKQKQLKAQEKKLKAQKSADERKKRTRHLIEIGGAVYSVLGREFVEGDVDRLISFLKGQDKRGGYFSRAMNDFPPEPKPEPAPTVEPSTDNNEPNEPKEETD